jgi:ornithine cyclodeaminase/alanine dehydrogenase-like protein (mu-crystallin family)
VNAVGACRPDWRELDDELARGARLYVESREAATRESGDVMAGTVVAEIGELVAGTAPGRQTSDEITLFKSVGVAAEDMAAAGLVYRLAGLPTPT